MSIAGRERVETPRLICERLVPEHAEELMALMRDPRVSRTLTMTGEPPTEAEVVEQVAAKVAHWERFGFGQWLLRERSSAQMVGRGGLQYTFLVGARDIEAGWAILPERWCEGFATELAHAAVQVAFDDLDLPGIIAFTQPDNIPSRRVMEKSGFVFERHIIHVGLPHVLYRRKRWR